MYRRSNGLRALLFPGEILLIFASAGCFAFYPEQEWPPHAVVWEPGGYLWVFRLQEATRWDTVTEQVAGQYTQETGTGEHAFVTVSGEVWTYGTAGIYRFQDEKWNKAPGLGQETEVYDMAETGKGTLWIATSKGYYFWDSGSEHWVRAAVPIIGKTLIEDNEGVLWFGGNGLLREDGETPLWTEGNGLVDDQVMSLLVARDGTVWVGTLWGIHQWNGTEWRRWSVELDLTKFDHNGDGYGIYELTEAADGEIWAGSYDAILYWDGETWNTFANLTNMCGIDIEFQYTQAGGLWLGCNRGLHRWDGEAWVRYGETQGIMDSEFAEIVESSDGELYVATVSGVYRYDALNDYWNELDSPP